jgi:transposase
MEHLQGQGDCLVDAGGCGADLSGAPGTAEHHGQVIDLPVVTPEVTGHRAQTRVCAGCGTATTAAFPDTMRAPVAYGGGSALHDGRKPET